MTGKPFAARSQLTLRSPLGRRLLAAFVLVALSSVVVLTAAALIGTARGLATARQSERTDIAARVAGAAATAYTDAHGWRGADLGTSAAAAEAAGARLWVRDSDDTMVWPGRGMGQGMGGMHGNVGGTVVEAPIFSDGQRVGTIRLVFPAGAGGGRTVAWSWVIGAALAALTAALAVSGYVTRRLTRPLVTLATAADRFARGERGVRADVKAPGELGDLARALDTMADEVVRAESVRRTIAADVAHELRTPLAALQAGLEELRDGLREPDPERLVALHDQSLRLSRVVTDLADLSAAEAAALSLKPLDTDLAEIARSALAAQRPQLTAAGLRVETDLDHRVPVRVDPDRVHQAVANLLANAARYCRSGDHVRVRAYADGGTAVLTVSDTGPGIPTDELPHVFERLWRGDNARFVAGSGIGLAVVRELITAHGGTVTASSPAPNGPPANSTGTDGGATFTIRLPLARPTT